MGKGGEGPLACIQGAASLRQRAQHQDGRKQGLQMPGPGSATAPRRLHPLCLQTSERTSSSEHLWEAHKVPRRVCWQKMGPGHNAEQQSMGGSLG